MAAAKDCETKLKRAKVIPQTVRMRKSGIVAAAILAGIVAIPLGLYLMTLGLYLLPEIKSWTTRLFASEQDLARKLEQMIAADTERARPFAIIKEGWPEDYKAMMQAGAHAMKETGVKVTAVNAAVQKEYNAWAKRNFMLAIVADDAALQNLLDRGLPLYRRLRAINRDICRAFAMASFDDGNETIMRELARMPKAEVRAIETERRLIGLAVVEAIASGRRLPQQRPGMSSADYAALFWQLADRGMSLNDFRALQNGLLPAGEFCDKFVNILEAISSVPDQKQRIRMYVELW